MSLIVVSLLLQMISECEESDSTHPKLDVAGSCTMSCVYDLDVSHALASSCEEPSKMVVAQYTDSSGRTQIHAETQETPYVRFFYIDFFYRTQQLMMCLSPVKYYT